MGSPPDRRALRELDAEAVARLAIDDVRWFKWATLELRERAREACEPAARAIVAAHRAGRAPAYLVASLLGACRSELHDPPT